MLCGWFFRQLMSVILGIILSEFIKDPDDLFRIVFLLFILSDFDSAVLYKHAVLQS